MVVVSMQNTTMTPQEMQAVVATWLMMTLLVLLAGSYAVPTTLN